MVNTEPTAALHHAIRPRNDPTVCVLAKCCPRRDRLNVLLFREVLCQRNCQCSGFLADLENSQGEAARGVARSSRLFCPDRGRKPECGRENAARHFRRAVRLRQKMRALCRKVFCLLSPAVCGAFQRPPCRDNVRAGRVPCFAGACRRIFFRIPDSPCERL